MAVISKKKIPFKINDELRGFLERHDRLSGTAIRYPDLLRYNGYISLYDVFGEDTLWHTVFYPQDEMQQINESLKHIYAFLKANGDLSVMKHLFIDRVDLCVYGNTQPFRVRVVNKINDNFDYFYVKNADASRVYGLELEDILSPNKINYLVYDQTLVEEHIAGIPGDMFMKFHLADARLNKIRLAKEFVKFNERSFARLLGDMHSSNFVIDITPDFEEVHYRIRAIDFDQQSYEGKRAVYMPQYFKQNNPLIKLGMEAMTPETVSQYQREERSMMANRLKASKEKVKDLLICMKNDHISWPQNEERLRHELADFYKEKSFLKAKNMAEILETSLLLLFKR